MYSHLNINMRPRHLLPQPQVKRRKCDGMAYVVAGNVIYLDFWSIHLYRRPRLSVVHEVIHVDFRKTELTWNTAS